MNADARLKFIQEALLAPQCGDHHLPLHRR